MMVMTAKVDFKKIMLILLAAMALMKRGTNKRVYGGV